MRSRSNGGVIGSYALPNQNYANGVFFIHDAAIYNTGNNPIWPLASGLIYSATGGTITTAADNNNYNVHTFTANGTFTVATGAAYIDVLLCGGGGSTGYRYQSTSAPYWALGGGGGGTVALVQNLFVDAGTTFTVEVGSGGTMGSYGTSSLPGVNGSPSKITSNKGHTVVARGGGAGSYGSDASGASGGSGGGGYAYFNSGTYTRNGGGSAGATDSYSIGTASINFYQNAGGNGDASGTGSALAVNAGGGGGAGSAGYNGDYSFDPSLRSYGGDGYLWSRTGLYYGAGGAGGTAAYNSASGLYGAGQRVAEGSIGVNGYGMGASATYFTGGNGGAAPKNGGSGTVIFVYRYR